MRGGEGGVVGHPCGGRKVKGRGGGRSGKYNIRKREEKRRREKKGGRDQGRVYKGVCLLCGKGGMVGITRPVSPSFVSAPKINNLNLMERGYVQHAVIGCLSRKYFRSGFVQWKAKDLP